MPESLARTLGLTSLHAVADAQITLAVNVETVWSAKLAAIGCHRTQFKESPILTAPPAPAPVPGDGALIRHASRGNAGSRPP